MSIGVPIKILHEAEGHIITCETTDGKYNPQDIHRAIRASSQNSNKIHIFSHILGEVYRGKLVEAEDSMNIQMTNITVTHRDGSVSPMQGCFLRGSKIVFVAMPDILKHAPVFNKVSTKAAQAPAANILRARGRGLGRGRPVSTRRGK